MTTTSSPLEICAICGADADYEPREDQPICRSCSMKADELFDAEMRRIELIRTFRGVDVELYDIKHPEASADKNHCGQIVIIHAPHGFEVKVALRSKELDWMAVLHDPDSGFLSMDKRLEALIGNILVLLESWGGGPHFMDIFFVDHIVHAEGEME